MVAGLGLLASPNEAARRLGLAATVFYLAHHIVVKTNLFLIGGIVRKLRGTEQLKKLGNLALATPWLAVLFLVPALSLAGIPPLSGFWAKLAMIRAGLEAQAWLVVAAAIAAGLMTLMSMIKIWNEAFWKPEPEGVALAPGGDPPSRGQLALLVLPAVTLACVTVFIGLYPQALLTFAGHAADQLLDPGAYIRAVGLVTSGGTP
jgi:multicomponent Na+:H+ antiporter subunit D